MRDRTKLDSRPEAAQEAFESGQVKTAIRLWTEMAGEGSGCAATALGDLYRNGGGVERDLAKAMGWYERAAELGNRRAHAAVRLGPAPREEDIPEEPSTDELAASADVTPGAVDNPEAAPDREPIVVLAQQTAEVAETNDLEDVKAKVTLTAGGSDRRKEAPKPRRSLFRVSRKPSPGSSRKTDPRPAVDATEHRRSRTPRTVARLSPRRGTQDNDVGRIGASANEEITAGPPRGPGGNRLKGRDLPRKEKVAKEPQSKKQRRARGALAVLAIFGLVATLGALGLQQLGVRGIPDLQTKPLPAEAPESKVRADEHAATTGEPQTVANQSPAVAPPADLLERQPEPPGARVRPDDQAPTEGNLRIAARQPQPDPGVGPFDIPLPQPELITSLDGLLTITPSSPPALEAEQPAPLLSDPASAIIGEGTNTFQPTEPISPPRLALEVQLTTTLRDYSPPGTVEPLEPEANTPANVSADLEAPAPDVAKTVEPSGPRQHGAENADARVILTATDEVLVQVLDGGGRVLLNEIFQPGDTYRVPNEEGIALVSDAPNLLDISIDGSIVVPDNQSSWTEIELDPDRLTRDRSANAIGLEDLQRDVGDFRNAL